MVQKIKPDNRRTRTLLVGLIIVLGIIWATNPPAKTALSTYLVISGICFFVYSFTRFRQSLIGIKTANAFPAVIWAGVLGGGFWLALKLVPGLSLGLPVVPNALADTMKFLVIVAVAPIVEEIFFRGVVMGYLKSMMNGKKLLPIIIQAGLFAIAHISAYITGFYNYPDFTAGMVAFSANVASFVAAFIFALIVGWFVSRDGMKNLIFAIVFHAIVNLIIYSSMTIIFAV